MSILSYPHRQNALLGMLKPIKRKVFISYHHKTDQAYYNAFSQYFSNTLDLFYDSSLERRLDSTNAEYLNRKIREEYIFGTSLTIVLCGPETWKRRWVDWEIHATLHHKHGLLGIILPTCAKNYQHKNLVPNRLYENLVSGYASLMDWTEDASILKTNMEATIQKSNTQTYSINNSATKMKRSLS